MELLEWVNRHRAALITGVGYASAAAVAITVFLYLIFPWQQLSDWIRARVEQTAAVEITVRESRVRFPFHLIWSGVTIRRPGMGQPASWTADEISASWSIGAMLRRRLDLDFDLKGLGGEARGRVTTRRSPQGMNYHLEASGKGFDLVQLAAAVRIPSQDISGTAGIDRLEHDWLNGNFLQGQGMLVLETKDVDLKRWGARFTKINGTVSLKGGMGQLENFTAQGDALDFVGSGSLLLRPDFMESLLNFSTRVTLHKPSGPLAILSAMATPDGRLDFALRGALRNPMPYVNGTAFGSIGVGGSKPPAVRLPGGPGR